MKPVNNKIQLQIDTVKIGAIQSDAIEERGVILALGQDVDTTRFKEGDTLLFKAWAVDVITIGDEKLYFITADSDAICGIDAI